MTDDARPAAASTSSAPGPALSSVKRLPELTRAAMWLTTIVIAVLTAGAVVVLWWPATAGLTGADLVKARLDALKIGLSIGVGSGGVVALYLAWRRQHSTEADLDNRERTLAHQQDVAATTQAHQERVADDARADAAERRITELYTKAVEQLGSDKAPVRLGGLYALERLAQNNETQRQTIANVLCAYLRMPYDLPAKEEREDGASVEQSEIYRARAQEREVRLAAQRLLATHLIPPHGLLDDPYGYWGPLALDLTGALLINFTLESAHVRTANFDETTFTGTTTFDFSAFTGLTTFCGATFAGPASFSRTHFDNAVLFTGANFADEISFSDAAFSGGVDFDRATSNGKPVQVKEATPPEAL